MFQREAITTLSSLLVLVWFNCFGITQAHADPLTIHGVNVGMSFQEIKEKLESRRYVCRDESPSLFVCTEASNPDGMVVGYTKPSLNINFNCEAYNGCHLSEIELAKFIEDAFDLSMNMQYFENEKSTCGVGSVGDKICLKSNFFASGGIKLTRHRMDKGNPLFD